MRHFALGLMVVATTLLAGGGRADAGMDRTCLKNARQDHKDCIAQCQDDYRSARLVCRNIDPACGKACLAGRQACRDNADQILSTGVLPDGSSLANCAGGTDACKATLQQAKQACGAPCQPTDLTCKECVDQAQIADFTCRDTCRDSWRTNATVIALLQACRDGFKQCVGQCPSATPAP